MGCKSYSYNPCFIQKLEICVQLKETTWRLVNDDNFTFWIIFSLSTIERFGNPKDDDKNYDNLVTYPFSISIIKNGPLSAVITKRHIVWRHIVAPETTKQEQGL